MPVRFGKGRDLECEEDFSGRQFSVVARDMSNLPTRTTSKQDVPSNFSIGSPWFLERKKFGNGFALPEN